MDRPRILRITKFNGNKRPAKVETDCVIIVREGRREGGREGGRDLGSNSLSAVSNLPLHGLRGHRN